LPARKVSGGIPGETKMYNLYEYGIQSEKSTHRIHVDVKDKVIFIYKTKDGINALPEPIKIVNDDDWIRGGYYIVKQKLYNREPSARGIRIPYQKISSCMSIHIPESILIDDCQTDSQRGVIGVRVAAGMLRMGLIPIQFDVSEINDKAQQISGLDLQADKLMIQVKYDWCCNERGLFLQTHEKNIEGNY
jgi:hypothetical protein